MKFHGKISELLETGELRAALAELKRVVEDRCEAGMTSLLRRQRQVITQHLFALTELENAFRDGAIDQNERTLSRQKIVAAVLVLAEEISSAPEPQIQAAADSASGLEPLVTPSSDCELFLSYARASKRQIDVLATWLQDHGLNIWFDKYIEGGGRFPSIIDAQIDQAKAVLVLWCQASVVSDWVIYEAARAHAQNKLIPLKIRTLKLEAIPAPYPSILNILDFGDEGGLARTLQMRGVWTSR